MSDPVSESGAAAPVCYRHPDRETWIRCQRCEKPICPDCMNSAAVGFQCPSCVKEGAKTTRTGRLPYGGEQTRNPALVSYILIGINLAVWVLITSAGGAGSEAVTKLSLLPKSTVFRMDDGSIELVKGVAGGAWWQILTSMFSHVEVWHVASNMIALYVFGPMLERILGWARFLALYLVAGLVGGTAVMLLSSEHSETLGASGAIFGIFGAMIVVALRQRIHLGPVLYIAAVPILFTFSASSYISWQGHLGGFVGGALAGAAIVLPPKVKQQALIQWAGLAAIAAISIAVIVLRAKALG